MPRQTPHRRALCALALFLLALAVHSRVQAQSAAPPAPLLVAPPDGAVTTGVSHPPLGIPLLDWNPAPQALLYHVQVAAAQPGGACDFSAPAVDSDTPATSFGLFSTAKPEPGSVLPALPDGGWCWRVKGATGSVFRPVWGPYSEAALFVKDWSNGGALRPALLLPEPGGETPARRAAFLPGDFRWTAVPGAATYRLEIASSGDFAPETIVYAASALGTTHTPTVRLPNGLYFRRVTPFDIGGNPGAASEPGQFDLAWDAPPQLLAPGDGIVTPFTPRFSWTAVEGAREYVLEVSTSPDFAQGATETYRTYNTDYTPAEALANNRDYYWRVRAATTAKVLGEDGTREVVSPYSAEHGFTVQWDFAPRLLTPAAETTGMGSPFFAWESVPAAERYQLQINETGQFISPFLADAEIYNVPAWTEPGLPAATEPFWWRVSALDAHGNSTPVSETRAYTPAATVGPNAVYPPPYYAPDTANLPVHSDRTLAWPVFVWDTAHETIANEIRIPAEYYRLTVDEQDDFATADFATPNILIETAGLGAAPTLADTLIPLEDGKLYSWRVQAFTGGTQIGGSLTWRFRYDATTPELPFAATATPIQPQDGFEAVGDPPVLGWLPVTGAARYRVQVADKAAFADVLDEAVTAVANYVPWQGRRQHMPSGEYWWRVRPEDGGGAPLGDWSPPRRFMLAVDLLTGNPFDLDPPGDSAGGNVQATSLLGPLVGGDAPGYAPTMTLIAASATAGAGSADLGALHMLVDRTYLQSRNWVIAFGAAGDISAGQAIYYGIYVDIDHVRDSGGTSPFTGAALPGDPLYRPEYFVEVSRTGNSVHAAGVTLRSWDAAAARWNAAQSLAELGGVAWFEPGSSAVQLLVPFAALGAERADFSGTLALTLFSSAAPGGPAADVVPPQGFDKPALVSDMLTPLYPFDTPSAQPRVFYDMPTLRWRAPYFDSVDRYEVQLARDDAFTVIVDTWETHEAGTLPFFELLPAGFQTEQPMADGGYVWRVRLCHERYIAWRDDLFDCGAWSQPMHFTLGSRRPQGLSPADGATTLATPAFAWDRVEGAASYVLQVGRAQDLDDPANVLFTKVTEATSFTPTDLQNGLEPRAPYFWRVAMRRADGGIGRWTEVLRFTKGSIAPAPVAPLTGTIVLGQPTFVWTAVLTPTLNPRLAAPRYRLVVDNDRDFGSPEFSVETQATSFTPPAGRGLKDGEWHWRVMLLDAGRHAGPESLAQTLAKVSPPPAITGPAPAASHFEPPALHWDAVEGAAYYAVEFGGDAQFRNTYTVYSAAASFTPPRPLDPGAHFWRVRAYDADGRAGEWAEGQFIFGQIVYLPAVTR